MTDLPENATSPKYNDSRNPNFPVQIPKKESRFEFVPRDTEESEIVGLRGFENMVFSERSMRETRLSHSMMALHSLAHDDGTPFYGEVGGWGRVPFSKNLMSPTPRRKWYLTTGRRAH